MAHLGAMLGYVGPAERHLGATWRQDEAPERPDEPRWRTAAPRRGKIGDAAGGAIHAASRPNPLRMDSPEWVSSMDLQTPTPAGTGSGKLEDWKSGGLENWRTG